MKKTLLLIVLACVMLVSSFAYASEKPTITVGSVVAEKGDVVTIDIDVSGNPGFAAMVVGLSYDRNVLAPVSVSGGEVLGNAGVVSNIQQGGDLRQYNPVSLTVINHSNFNGDGTVFQVKFEVIGELYEDVNLKLSYDVGDICNQNFGYVDFEIVQGAILSKHQPVQSPEGEVDNTEDSNKEIEEEPKAEDSAETTDVYTDVSANDWFSAAVDYVTENGLMNGTSATTFAPNGNLTRAMLVTVLYRADGAPNVPQEQLDQLFDDVAENSWYQNAVAWAKANAIVNGVSETAFAPNQNITREQIAAIMYRYAQYKGYDVTAEADLSAYNDAANVSGYATKAMQYAVGAGYINGKTSTTLNPKDNATRAEIATILQRFIEANK